MALVVAGVSVVQPYVLARSAVAVSCPADTTEDVLATVTIPAGAMGISGAVRVTTVWTITNSANAKTLRMRFGGTSGTAYLSTAATTSASFSDCHLISNRGSASSQVGSAQAIGLGGSAAAVITSSVDTASATTIVISGQKASAGETLTLESYLVELFPTV